MVLMDDGAKIGNFLVQCISDGCYVSSFGQQDSVFGQQESICFIPWYFPVIWIIWLVLLCMSIRNTLKAFRRLLRLRNK